jgi:hypothetical protein
MRNRAAQDTRIEKTPNPTTEELSEVWSVEPSSAVVDVVEPSLLVAEVVVVVGAAVVVVLDAGVLVVVVVAGG